MSRAPRQSSRSLLPVIALLVVLLAAVVTYDVRSRAAPVARTVPVPSSSSAGARGASDAALARRAASATAGGSGSASASEATAGSAGEAAPGASRDTASWPLHGRRARRAPVPILMWHVVAQPRPGTPYPELWVSPAQFTAQVAALRTAGFTAVTMDELWRAWHGPGRLPARPVVLSFDDGDLSHLAHAVPVLADAGWPGVLNLAVNHLGTKGLPRWAARRLLQGGWELGSHTVDHLDLTALDDAALADQLTRSRTLIRSELGVDARSFCYPAGRNDERVRAAVARQGPQSTRFTASGCAAAAGLSARSRAWAQRRTHVATSPAFRSFRSEGSSIASPTVLLCSASQRTR